MIKYFIHTLLTITFLLIFSLPSKADVIRISVDGAISPASASYIKEGIKEAEKSKADALLIELNTPGGLLESTRDIVQYIFSSRIPVIVYVAPGGARAGSAGVFITLAANIAAMAPGTNIGAAHPVGLGGESDSSKVMYDKVTNDAAAFIRSIAQKRKRNQDWAENAVRNSISATENEAFEQNAIDFIAPNAQKLLMMVDGMKIETAKSTVTLKTAGKKIIDKEMNWKEILLSIISDPNVAYIFVLLAMYGILFELYNPGSIFPGVIGGISAILAAYSLQILPVNYSGLLLILLAVVLFIIEIKVVSYGLLTIGGIVAFILGSTMLIESPVEVLNISISLIIIGSIATTLFFLVVISLGIKAQYRKTDSGAEGMIGKTGIAITAISKGQKGKIKAFGEIWTAVSDSEINPGDEVIIEEAKSLTIKVKKLL